MWKNKHVVIALLVAPILALLAYFATDRLVSERPHAARAGESYPLVAKSNCRYESGECDLVNGELKLTLEADRAAAQLRMSSTHALSDAVVAVAQSPEDDVAPQAFSADDASTRMWSAALPAEIGQAATLRLVVTAGDSQYFAEVPTVFFESATVGSR